MKNNSNRFTRHRRIIHLVVTFFFFLSCYISPALSSSKVQPPKKNPSKTDDGLQSGYEELWMAKAMLLSPSVSEMSDSLKVLQKEYPRQAAFWQELSAQLPEGDPIKAQLEELIEKAQLMFPPIIAYADQFAKEQKEIEKGLSKGKNLSKEVRVYQYARLMMLLHLREKLGFYEAASQSIFTKLYRILLERLKNPASEPFKKVHDFEKLRKAQMSKYHKARKEYDQMKLLVFNMEQPLNLNMRIWLWGNVDVSFTLANDLAELISNGNSPMGQKGDESVKLISKELAEIALDKVRELTAMDAVFSQNHEESLWSILYIPPISEDISSRIRDRGHPGIQMAIRLAQSLEAMRPELNRLARFLTERNRLLNASPLLKTDFFENLRGQIILEEIPLKRLTEALSIIEKFKKRPEEIVRDMELAALYEELGFLKEEVMTVESFILNELRVLINSTPLTSDPRWPQLSALLKEEERWKKNFQSYESNWKLSVKRFEDYQLDLLNRCASTLHELRQHVKYQRETSSPPADPMGQPFIGFIEEMITKRLEDIESAIETKSKMIEFADVDPLYAHLFGVHPNNFWHVYLGQGHIFYDLERLIAQKNKIMENLRNLFKQNVNRQQQAILILRTARDFGLIQDIGRNPKGYVVVMGSGDHSFILEGLVLSQQPDLYRMPVKHASSSLIKMNPFVLNLLSPNMAYAGIGNFWDNLKQNWSVRSYRDNLFSQGSKNKWSYAMLGIIGGVLAIPTGGASLIPLGVQFAADSYIAAARSAVKAGNPQQAIKFDRYIDHVETAYNIGQVVESGYKIFTRPTKGAESVRKFTQKGGDAVQRAGSEAVDKIRTLAPNQKFWGEMADDAANTVANNPRWSSEVKQTVMEVSDFATRRAVDITDQMTGTAQNVRRLSETTQQNIKNFSRLVSGTERVVENIIDFGDAPVDAWGGGEGLVEIGRDAMRTETGSQTNQPPVPTMSAQDYIRLRNEAEQKRNREGRDRTTRDLSRIQTTHGATPSSADGTTATSSTGGTTPTTTGGPQVQTPPGGTGTTTPTKTGETLPPKTPRKPEPPKTPVKPEPPPASTIKPSTIDFPDSSGRFKIMVHFPKGAGKSYKNEKVGNDNDNVIVIMCPGYGKFVSNEPVELSVLGSGIGKWTVYANRNLSDPTTRRLLQTLTNMSSDTYYYVVIYDRNRNDLSVTYFTVRATK